MMGMITMILERGFWTGDFNDGHDYHDLGPVILMITMITMIVFKGITAII